MHTTARPHAGDVPPRASPEVCTWPLRPTVFTWRFGPTATAVWTVCHLRSGLWRQGRGRVHIRPFRLPRAARDLALWGRGGLAPLKCPPGNWKGPPVSPVPAPLFSDGDMQAQRVLERPPDRRRPQRTRLGAGTPPGRATPRAGAGGPSERAGEGTPFQGCGWNCVPDGHFLVVPEQHRKPPHLQAPRAE